MSPDETVVEFADGFCLLAGFDKSRNKAKGCLVESLFLLFIAGFIYAFSTDKSGATIWSVILVLLSATGFILYFSSRKLSNAKYSQLESKGIWIGRDKLVYGVFTTEFTKPEKAAVMNFTPHTAISKIFVNKSNKNSNYSECDLNGVKIMLQIVNKDNRRNQWKLARVLINKEGKTIYALPAMSHNTLLIATDGDIQSYGKSSLLQQLQIVTSKIEAELGKSYCGYIISPRGGKISSLLIINDPILSLFTLLGPKGYNRFLEGRLRKVAQQISNGSFVDQETSQFLLDCQNSKDYEIVYQLIDEDTLGVENRNW